MSKNINDRDRLYESNLILERHDVEYKDSGKHSLSKNDLELFDENKNVPNTVVRVKRMGSVDKNERWRIIVDNELKFIIEGDKLTKKESSFLRTVEGVTFLIQQYKMGIKSISELKAQIKRKI